MHCMSAADCRHRLLELTMGMQDKGGQMEVKRQLHTQTDGFAV